MSAHHDDRASTNGQAVRPSDATRAIMRQIHGTDDEQAILAPSKRARSRTLRIAPPPTDPELLAARVRGIDDAVQIAPINALIRAASPYPWRIHPATDLGASPGGLAFPCPACAHDDQTTPTALVIDEFTWRCTACRAAGTRWQLAHQVLTDPAALDRFLRAAHEPTTETEDTDGADGA